MTTNTDRTRMEQVADTLDFCKAQLLLCREVLTKENRGFSAWSHIGLSLNSLMDALDDLERHGIIARKPEREPVPGAADA